MKLIIEVEFPGTISPQRERDIKNLVQEFKEDLSAHGGKVTKADLVHA